MSGGGYIGGWLSAWTTRLKGIENVVPRLRADAPPPGPAEPDPDRAPPRVQQLPYAETRRLLRGHLDADRDRGPQYRAQLARADSAAAVLPDGAADPAGDRAPLGEYDDLYTANPRSLRISFVVTMLLPVARQPVCSVSVCTTSGNICLASAGKITRARTS